MKNNKVTWFGIKVCYEKDFFVILWLFACFLFLNNKTRIKLSEQENKSVGTLWRRWVTTKTINPKLESTEIEHTPTHAHMHLQLLHKKTYDTCYGLQENKWRKIDNYLY